MRFRKKIHVIEKNTTMEASTISEALLDSSDTRAHDNKPQFSRKKTLLFLVVIYTIFAISMYSGYVVFRTLRLYLSVKSNQRGWRGKVHTCDTELGFAPIPDSQGAHVFPIGPEIPMRYDIEGFRVPVDTIDTSSRPRSLVLVLGCSYTYGDAAYAEETYPYLVGQRMGGSSINAGVCSYGLSQMLILAERLIPRYKPDYVLVQYSPWLVRRAQSGFAPLYFGKCPTPFFFKKQDDLGLHPPVFKAKVFDLAICKYRQRKRSVADFVSFQISFGWPLFLYDDFNMLIYRAKRFLGMIPPAASGSEIVETVYRKIAQIAEANESKMTVVVLGRNTVVDISRDLPAINATVVNAYSKLIERLSAKGTENSKKPMLIGVVRLPSLWITTRIHMHIQLLLLKLLRLLDALILRVKNEKHHDYRRSRLYRIAFRPPNVDKIRCSRPLCWFHRKPGAVWLLFLQIFLSLSLSLSIYRCF